MDAIDLVEAAYDLNATEDAWLRHLGELAIPFVRNGARRAVCYRIQATPAGFEYSLPATVGFAPSFAKKCLVALHGMTPHAGQLLRPRKVSTMSEQLGATLRDTPMGKLIVESGAEDSFGCVAMDAEGRGVVVSTDLPRCTRLPRATRDRWQLIGAHVAAALRLRRKPLREEAVVTPGGRVVHAECGASSTASRERLRAAVVARDLARTRARRVKADEALALWSGLVAGRWSLVDRFESDGRRFVVARRNLPEPAGPLALTLRERQVLSHLLQGDSNKLIAYSLGIAPSTASEATRSLMLKLGVRNVAELTRLASTLARQGTGDGARPPR